MRVYFCTVKNRVFSFLSLFFTAGFLYCQDTITLQLKWLDQFQFAGFYAAQQKGFYEAEGIYVKIIPGRSSISPVDEVTQGRADFGVSGSDLLLDYEKGKPVVVLGVIFQHSPYVFLSLRESNINTPADLVGKKVMVSEVQGWVQLKAMLLKEGISPDSVTILPHSWNNNDLFTGKVDAISAYSSVEPFQLSMAGYPPSMLQPASYGVDFYGDVLFTTEDMVTNHPDLTERFRRASFKGWAYAMEHKAEMVDYILSIPSVSKRGITRELLMNEAAQMDQLMSSSLVEPGHMNPSRWQHILNTYKKLGMVSDSATMDNFIYRKKPSFYESHSHIIRLVAGIVSFLLLLLMFNSVMMRRLVRKKTALLEKEMAEKMRTQTELEKSQEILALAADVAAIGCWDWNPDNGSFIVDDHWLQLFGYKREDTGRTTQWFRDLLHPDDLPEMEDKARSQLSTNFDSFSSVSRFRMKTGEWKWALSNSKVVSKNAEGRITRIVGITVDMDKLKNKEKELYAITRELTHTNKELQQFAYITSHNLRAPVANIISLLRLMPEENLSAETRDLLSKISICTFGLHDTLDELNMILTNVFSSAHEEDSEIDFKTRLAILNNSISEFIRSRDAEIISDFSRVPSMQYPLRVFDSILLNLVTNAIKYRHPKRKPIIHISSREEAGYYVLEISDNGLGIDIEKYQHKLFRLYQRFHEGAEGKGIGLYLVRNQVEAHEGKITVSSEPGTGSTFTVYFRKKRYKKEL